MNPFTLLNHELETDKSDDDVSAAFRFLLPLWAAAWDDSPESYVNAYDTIVAEVSALFQCPLQQKMLRYASELANSRKTAPHSAAY